MCTHLCLEIVETSLVVVVVIVVIVVVVVFGLDVVNHARSTRFARVSLKNTEPPNYTLTLAHVPRLHLTHTLCTGGFSRH